MKDIRRLEPKKEKIPEPKLFTMYRNLNDESNVSGTGRVLDGMVGHNGKVVVIWRTDKDARKHGFSSIGVYDSFENFKAVHIDSHPSNGTVIKFL